jgi:ferredoxin
MPRRIDPDICINCGACEPQCPVSVISEKDGKYRFIDESGCIDCGACQAVCPVDAISEV